jgi:hypothetical protein
MPLEAWRRVADLRSQNHCPKLISGPYDKGQQTEVRILRPDWTAISGAYHLRMDNDIFPDAGDRISHKVRMGGGPMEKGYLERPGAFLSQTLRVACKLCNSTWMSGIVNRARPSLSQLIQGKWPLLNRFECKALSTWAILTTMVHEFGHLATQCSTQVERDYIREKLEPPANWRTWIAPHEGEPKAWIWHRGGGPLSPLSDTIPPKCSYQTTIIALGGVALQTASTTTHPRSVHDLSKNRGPFTALQPRRLYPISKPRETMNAASAAFHIESFNSAINWGIDAKTLR